MPDEKRMAEDYEIIHAKPFIFILHFISDLKYKPKKVVGLKH